MTSPTAVAAALRCTGVSAGYRGRDVVHDVDLEVRPGEWLGLIGPNGAGKSTLLGAMAGLREHRGTVVVGGGRRPSGTDIALVPQTPTLPEGMTVAEYVLLGRTAHLGWLARESGHDRSVVSSVLRRLDLVGFAERPVVSLSGGEAQRAVVARALAQQSPLLLLDEPTSALDLGHQVAVLALVDDLRRADGLAVIAAMHDLSGAARFADRLVLMDLGRVVAEGDPATVLDPELLSQTYGTPLTVRRIDGELVVLPASRRRGKR